MGSVRTGFFQVAHRREQYTEVENSMGRLIAFMAACTGIGVIVFGCVFKNAGIIGIGAGLFSSGELLKYGQKVVER